MQEFLVAVIVLTIILVSIKFYPFFRLMKSRSISELYENVFDLCSILYDKDPNINEQRWLNYGVWDDNTKTIEDACCNLAIKLAEMGEFNENDAILDVGCGNGTSTKFWTDYIDKKYGSKPKITGINITESQIQSANKLISGKSEYSGNIEFQVSDATNMDNLEDEIFTKVVALECAFHFNTREKFFYEAMRVLKPNGKIILSDIVAKDTPGYRISKKYLPSFFVRPVIRLIGQPVENYVNIHDYIEILRKAGFKKVKYEYTTEKTLKTIDHYNKKIQEIDAGKIPGWLEPFDWKKYKDFKIIMAIVNKLLSYSEYVVIAAEK